METVWKDGGWIGAGDFRIDPGDRGLLHGLGLFETLLAVEGRPAFVDRHLGRLAESCRRLGWPEPPGDLAAAMGDLLRKNGLEAGRARIRLTVTAGEGAIADVSAGARRSVWMRAEALRAGPEEVAVNVSPWRRNERSPLVGMKCAAYAENLAALDHARREGFGETIFLNGAGCVCEAATANVFAVTGGRLATPPLSAGCLPGVTRGVVLELARAEGVECVEADLSPEELGESAEVFLTSATRGPVRVSRLGEKVLGAGPLFPRLRERWLEAVGGE